MIEVVGGLVVILVWAVLAPISLIVLLLPSKSPLTDELTSSDIRTESLTEMLEVSAARECRGGE